MVMVVSSMVSSMRLTMASGVGGDRKKWTPRNSGGWDGGVPGRKQDRDDQRRHHPIQDVEAQLLRCRGRRGCAVVSGTIGAEALAALGAEPINLRQ